MSTPLTEITEITTALGTLTTGLPAAFAERPDRLLNVSNTVWDRLVLAYKTGAHAKAFALAFANGRALLEAEDGLRCRSPKLVEWKGPHRPPGDDVIPADIRIDHVYQVSCKYLSRILHNPGPARLFDRLLVGEDRSRTDWFSIVAPLEYQRFYSTLRTHLDVALPDEVRHLEPSHRATLKQALKPRTLPACARAPWIDLCVAVSVRSADRWSENLANDRSKLRLLWRLLRIGDAPYFVLGTNGNAPVRVRVASAWDWVQSYQLRSFTVTPRRAGQPEVGWRVAVRHRLSGEEVDVHGHVEVRWSHGRFQGSPEAKVYLDVPPLSVPGYFPLV